MEDLKKSTKALEEDVNINKEDFRRAINQVIKQAKEGPEFLQQKGPGLINKLANDYIDEVRMRTIAAFHEKRFKILENQFRNSLLKKSCMAQSPGFFLGTFREVMGGTWPPMG